MLCTVNQWEMVIWLEWNLSEEVRALPQIDECSTPLHKFIMNIIIWNNRGTLKSNLQSRVRELNQAHSPAIMLIMETHLGGPKAKEITDRLPFDGVIHTETIG